MLPLGINIAHHDKICISSNWVLPRYGRKLEMVSSNIEQVVARCAEADAADMDAAVAAARTVF